MILILQAVKDELLLFALVGFFLGGVDDLCFDLAWLWCWLAGRRRPTRPHLAAPILAAAPPAPFNPAVFVPAWREEAVIADMLRAALARWDGQRFDIFVGCYRNDPATIHAAKAVRDCRIHVISSDVDGPTTKADCLNRLYQAMQRHAAATGAGYQAVVLHDAEDLVHPQELTVFGEFIGRFSLIQLPVLPLHTKGSRWISGHYLDEFTEAHSRDMVVRSAVGTSLPAAGVGCAIKISALDDLARENGGHPFAVDSVTEDYELGLRITALGRRSIFVRRASADGRDLIATRAHFPCELIAAVRQKARWTMGIALAGWDRLGWSQSWFDNWMRWRDRRSPFAAVILVSGYAAVLLSIGLFFLDEPFLPQHPWFRFALRMTALFLSWRLLIRALCVGHHYGWRSAILSIPRSLVANIITILAARVALFEYLSYLRSGLLVWEKTQHRSPLDA